MKNICIPEKVIIRLKTRLFDISSRSNRKPTFGQRSTSKKPRRRRVYAPTSNTTNHDNHEKINSWVSFAFLYGYGAPIGGPFWAAGALLWSLEVKVCKFPSQVWLLKFFWPSPAFQDRTWLPTSPTKEKLLALPLVQALLPESLFMP